MTSNGLDRARRAADEIFEKGSHPDDIRAALADLGDQKRVFLNRLAVHASLQAAEDSAVEDEPPASILDEMMARYEAERGATRKVDLAQPSTWVAAKAAFGNDMEFIIKLFERRVTRPSRRFILDAADALGATFAQVAAHFDLGTGLPPVGVERKASGKQSGPEVESFEAAVHTAKLPSELKKRWLSE